MRRLFGIALEGLMARQAELGVEDAYAYASEVMTRNMLARDAEEGLDAFIAKRPPVWQDR